MLDSGVESDRYWAPNTWRDISYGEGKPLKSKSPSSYMEISKCHGNRDAMTGGEMI